MNKWRLQINTSVSNDHRKEVVEQHPSKKEERWKKRPQITITSESCLSKIKKDYDPFLKLKY